MYKYWGEMTWLLTILQLPMTKDVIRFVSPNPYAAGDLSSPNKSVFGSKTRCHLFGDAKQQPKWWNICWSSGALAISIDLRKNSTENGVSAARFFLMFMIFLETRGNWNHRICGGRSWFNRKIRTTNRRFLEKFQTLKESRIDKASH